MTLRRLAPALATAAIAGAAAAARAAPPAEPPGLVLYRDGRLPGGGTVTATVGEAVLPGEAVPCAGCHGDDGRGRPEGGVAPPDISWSTLTRPYGHVHPDGRKHPAYDERTLLRAIADGVDPAGNRLAPAMPRYAMPRSELLALIDHLRTLEDRREPGVGEAVIRIATVLPSTGPLAEPGAAARQLLEAELAALDRGGGLHGRRLELVVVPYGAGERGLDRLRALHDRDPVFAVVGGIVPGEEAALGAWVERTGVPWIGPLTPFDPGGDGPVFRPVAGLPEQARVLIRHAATALPAADRVGAIVHPQEPGHAAVARAAAEEARRAGLRVETRPYARGAFDTALAGRLRRDGARFVLFLGGDEELAAFAGQAARRGFAPYLLVPGAGAVRAAATVPPAFAGRVRLAFSAVPTAERRPAVEALGQRSSAFRAGRHRAALVATHAGVAVLAEGLRCAGRQLDRRRLVACLERLQGLDTGLVPPIGFGPGRRVGSPGGYVVVPDPAARTFRPQGDFVRLDAAPER